MSEPDLDKLTSELFDAARAERPSDEKKRAILEAVERAGPAGPGTGARPLSRWVRWGGFAVLVGLGALALWGFDEARVEPAPPQAVAEPARPPEPVEPRLEAPVAPQVEAQVEPQVEPQVPAEAPSDPSAEPPSPRRPGRPAVAEVDALAAEVQLVDAARGALSVEPAAALKTLDAYRQRFPRGSLRVEADLVRLEALLRAGRRGEAERLAKRLIASDPGAPVAARAQRLLEGSP